MKTDSKRIYGFDLARGLALVGMVLVNFKTVMVLPSESDKSLYHLLELLSGKAAALFVVLAGVGMTLMWKGAMDRGGKEKAAQVRIILWKRALFLFVVGMSYYVIWPADILHYYGVYLSFGVLFLALSRATLIASSLFLILIYPILLVTLNYEAGWDWNTLEYTDFFTPTGFFRNLFFNGFHPVIPWIAFLLTGVWVGRLDFNNKAMVAKLRWSSLVIFVLFTILSWGALKTAGPFLEMDAESVDFLFSTGPMPPSLFYMLSASSLAVFLITLCVSMAKRFPDSLVIRSLISGGQLALTNYFAHVVLGMLGLLMVTGKLEQAFSIEFAFGYSLLFSLFLVIGSHLWKMKKGRGPLETLMRKVTG
ncbi:DUF1624 domain-containing protein [bacterium SCSIO 12741]|nr:DUF1624 domain-containing protein [bacterium SCSIO 12741]